MKKSLKDLLGELRAKNESKISLAAKRKELRSKLIGHRDQTSAEYSELSGDYYQIDEQLDTVRDEIDAVRAEISEAQIEEGKRTIPNVEDATASQREEMLSSKEYNHAFFRSIINGKISKDDSDIMAFGQRAVTDMNGDGVSSGANYLIPTTTYNMILSVIKEYGQVYSAISKTGFSGDISIPIGTLNGKTENADGTFTLDFVFSEVKISQEAIIGSVIVKNLLLKNSISALESFIVEQIGKQIALQLDNGIINGDGGSFKGILEELIAVAYTTLDYDTIINIEHALKRAYSKTAGFIMNWTTFGKCRKIKDENKNPIGKTDVVVKINGMDFSTIDGKAVLIVDEVIMGDDDILYGNLASYRVNESQSMVIESNASPEFKSDKTVYRGKVYSGGQPVLATENFVLYSISTDKVATPTATPGAGAVASGTEITLASATTGTTIYYTVDGSTPTRNSTKYVGTAKPSVTGAVTIKAIAVKKGMVDSAVLSAAYTLS
jgi:HK97 family phage major capsid protein